MFPRGYYWCFYYICIVISPLCIFITMDQRHLFSFKRYVCHLLFLASGWVSALFPFPTYPFQWLKSRPCNIRWIFLSNSSEWGPVGIFKCGSRKEKYLDIIGSAKGSQISKKYWGGVGKGKRADVCLEVGKRRGHMFFEWNKCLCYG